MNLRDRERQRAAEGLKALQWDVELMMHLSPSQRRAIDAAVKALDRNPVLDSLRALLPPGHPLAE
ncbi:MAG TPA: hypothetical protein VGI19_14325 [Candidatus Cybelea sp.]